MPIQVDIIGGGLAGLSAAIALKKYRSSINVIVHEKHKEIGYNPEGRRCGEAHSVEREWAKWQPDISSVFNEIRTVITYVGAKKRVIHRPAGASCILNRQTFISQLGREAARLGATIHTHDRIQTSDQVDGDIVIDASGCPSTLKRYLDIKPGLTGSTFQQTLEVSNAFVADTVQIFFTGELGYYWVFPRDPEKKEVNLGVGVIGAFDGNLKKMLEKFKETHEITGTVNYTLGGLIPAGLQPPFSCQNILFIGDAGVGAFPLTGQGIYRALISGDLAAKCIAQGHPEKYPHLVYQSFIKWEIIGKMYLHMNTIMQKIGKKAAIAATDWFLQFTDTIH